MKITVLLFIVLALVSLTSTCGDFPNCVSYTPDGCNTCTCGEGGFAACTKMGCALPDEPACLKCADGYRVNKQSGQCQANGGNGGGNSGNGGGNGGGNP